MICVFLNGKAKRLFMNCKVCSCLLYTSGSGSEYLPHNFIRHCVAYTGTHDNDTIAGWMSSAGLADVAHAVEYLRLSKEEGYHWGMMRALWGSVADLTIIQAQDILGLGSEARMNTPVSYTHLDVYKRQAPCARGLSRE